MKSQLQCSLYRSFPNHIIKSNKTNNKLQVSLISQEKLGKWQHFSIPTNYASFLFFGREVGARVQYPLRQAQTQDALLQGQQIGQLIQSLACNQSHVNFGQKNETEKNLQTTGLKFRGIMLEAYGLPAVQTYQLATHKRFMQSCIVEIDMISLKKIIKYKLINLINLILK